MLYAAWLHIVDDTAYMCFRISEFEADAGIRQTIAVPACRIEVEYVFFRRAPQHIVQTTAQRHKSAAKSFLERISHVYTIDKRLAMSAKLRFCNGIRVVGHIYNFS